MRSIFGEMCEQRQQEEFLLPQKMWPFRGQTSDIREPTIRLSRSAVAILLFTYIYK